MSAQMQWQSIDQVLTKRSDRMMDWCSRYQPKPLPHVWLGVSVEDRLRTTRIYDLRETPATRKRRWIVSMNAASDWKRTIVWIFGNSKTTTKPMSHVLRRVFNAWMVRGRLKGA